jgi:hypothetical protein
MSELAALKAASLASEQPDGHLELVLDGLSGFGGQNGRNFNIQV